MSVMKAVLVVALVALVAQCEALSCIRAPRRGQRVRTGTPRPVEPPLCSRATECQGGRVMDACGWCLECAKVLGERCGGDWHQLGRCDLGLYCNKIRVLPEIDFIEVKDGITIRPLREIRLETDGKCSILPVTTTTENYRTTRIPRVATGPRTHSPNNRKKRRTTTTNIPAEETTPAI